MKENILLAGFGVGGYRSLRELQPVGGLRKVTLLAGQNNSGKSNILRFAQSFLKQYPDMPEWADKPKPDGPPLRMQIAHSFSGLADLQTKASQLANPEAVSALLQRDVFRPVPGEAVWLTYAAGETPLTWSLDEEWLRMVASTTPGNVLEQASMNLESRSGGAATDDARRVLENLFPFKVPPVRTVGAFRQISSSGTFTEGDALSEDYSGQDLIHRLANLQSPSSEKYDVDRPRFEAIEQFARTVLEDNDVTIRVSAGQDELQVVQGGRALPLSSLGTGIHQVIILATAATLLTETLVCIEEPEVHLHPLLQRKLVRYLSEATSNQYLIATHSAHLLDYERACVLHVKHDADAGTQVSEAATVQEVSNLCSDLGYRPSDLIQANSVIWVEGPSDRIYLRYWLDIVAPNEFLEGIHYSVMFYGGGLLNHLTADDPSVEEFISLRRLNRHSTILIDSDKTSASSKINATKVRVQDEFERDDMPGFAWVTACRTIENYVPLDTLVAAVKTVHPRSHHQPPANRWADPLHLTSGKSEMKAGEAKRTQPDKVKVAREACQKWPEKNLPLDLANQLQKVVAFIRAANGSAYPLPVRPSA